MKRLSVFLIALLALAFASLGQANIILIVDEAGAPQFSPPPTETQPKWFVESTGAFQGLLGTPVVLSDKESTARTNISSDPDQQLIELNELLFDAGLQTVTGVFESPEGDLQSFTTNREYFSIKTSTWVAFFKNISGGAITVSFDDRFVSNYREFGGVVPIPAAFILFGSGLVGLGWLARRQRARKEESVA